MALGQGEGRVGLTRARPFPTFEAVHEAARERTAESQYVSVYASREARSSPR